MIAKVMEVGKNILGDTTFKRDSNTPEEWAALQKAKSWLEDDRSAKSEFADEMKEMHKAYMGDHWSLKGPTGKELRSTEVKAQKPNSVDNMVFSMVEGFVAEFSNVPELVNDPTERNDDNNATALDELNDFLLNKNKFPDEQQKLLRYMFKYGPGIVQDFWDPSWQGGRGPNRWIGDARIKALHPDVLYIDARCKDNIQDARRIHKVIRYPLEHFKETYEDKGQHVEEDTSSYFETVGSDEEDSKSKNRTAWKVETWYKGKPLFGEDKGYGLHVLTWAGDVALKHQTYIYPEPKYPFVFRNLYDREGSIWGFGEIKQIISPQIIMNKEDELIIEGNMHQAFGQTFYTTEAINEKQVDGIVAKGSLPGMWFPVTDIAGIKREYGQGVPASIFNHKEAKQRAIEAITGRFDTTQGKVPSGITAASAIIELNSKATNRMKAKSNTLNAVYQEIGEHNNDYISWYYEEKRGYRITGTDGNPEFKDFQNSQIKKVHIFADSAVLPLEQFQPTEGMVEGQDYEVYSPEFDVKVKVDNEMPSGRAYFMELSKELFTAGIIDRRAVLYAIENGKLEPMDEILARMEQAQVQMQTQTGGAALPGGDVPPQEQSTPEQQMIQQFFDQLPPETQDKIMQLPPEEQLAHIEQLIKQGN